MADKQDDGDVLIVGYDGTASAKRAVQHATSLIKSGGGRIHLVHVLEWSPYSFLTPEELSERHKRREEELTRAKAIVQPVIDDLNAKGLNADCEIRHGHAGELLCELAEDMKARQIIIGRTGSTSIAARLMGSLALTLVQASPVPVTVVP
ncbi:MAG: universal stress protein [Geminicoccaceae bacterium]